MTNAPQQFWASAVKGLVQVGTGNVFGQNILMSYQDPNPLAIKNVGVKTVRGATGSWNVCRQTEINDAAFSTQAVADPGVNIIKGLFYAGVSTTDPSRNFFLAMISEVTLDKMMGVLGDTISSQFHTWRKQIPVEIKQSGLYPINTNCDRTQILAPATYPNCFARIAYSALGSHSIVQSTGPPLVVMEGFSMAARIRFCGWETQVQAVISPTRLYVNASMDPINIDGTITVVRDRLTTNIGPHFIIDFNMYPQSAFIDIMGYVNIPKIETFGEVIIKLNDKGFRFLANVTFLGAFHAEVMVAWSWNLKNPDFEFHALVSMGSLGDCVSNVKKAVTTIVDSAKQVLGNVQNEMAKVSGALGRICQELKDKANMGDIAFKLCQTLPLETLQSTVDALMNPVKDLLEKAKNIITGLIDTALNNIPLERIFWINKLELYGKVDGSFTKSAVGGTIDITAFGQNFKYNASVNTGEIAKWMTSEVTRRRPQLAELKNQVDKEWDKVKNSFVEALNKVKSWVEDRVNAVGDRVNAGGNAISNTASNAYNGATTAASNAYNGATTAASNAYTYTSDAYKEAKKNLPGWMGGGLVENAPQNRLSALRKMRHSLKQRVATMEIDRLESK